MLDAVTWHNLASCIAGHMPVRILPLGLKAPPRSSAAGPLLNHLHRCLVLHRTFRSPQLAHELLLLGFVPPEQLDPAVDDFRVTRVPALTLVLVRRVEVHQPLLRALHYADLPRCSRRPPRRTQSQADLIHPLAAHDHSRLRSSWRPRLICVAPPWSLLWTVKPRSGWKSTLMSGTRRALCDAVLVRQR